MSGNLKLFRFVAVDTQDRLHKGYLYSATAEEVSLFLQKIKLQSLSVTYRPPVFIWILNILFFFSSRFRITKNVRVSFYRGFSDMVRAKFPLNLVIVFMLNNTRCIPLKKKLYQSYKLVTDGYSLMASLSVLPPKLFGRRELMMIKSAEKLGGLDQAFSMLADEADMRSRALIQIFTNVFSMITLMVIGVLASNQFANRFLPYVELHAQLQNYPLSEVMVSYRAVFGGNMLINILYYIGVVAGVFVINALLRRLYFYGQLMDYIKLHLPYLNKTIKQTEVANFCFAFSLALNARMPLQKAFANSVDSIMNVYLRHDTRKLSNQLVEGFDFEALIKRSKVFSIDEQHLLISAARGGTLHDAAETLREYSILKTESNFKIKLILVRMSMILIVVAIALFNVVFAVDATFHLIL
jgi:type II secretory pathway component PulF